MFCTSRTPSMGCLFVSPLSRRRGAPILDGLVIYLSIYHLTGSLLSTQHPTTDPAFLTSLHLLFAPSLLPFLSSSSSSPSSTTIAVTLFPLCLAPLQEPSPAGCDVRSFSLLTSHSSVCLRRLKTFLGVWTSETNASWGVFFLPSTLSKFRLWFVLFEVLQRQIFRELLAGWVSKKALLLLLLLSLTGPTEVERVVVENMVNDAHEVLKKNTVFSL